MNILEGSYRADGLKIAIAVSRFNSFISERLLDGAIDAIVRNGGNLENVTIFKVPGSFELPSVVKKIVELKKFDGIITLGAVIRGSTPHFDYVANEVSKGIASLSLSSNIPIVFGVLTTDSIEQAIERAGAKMGNKGTDAAQSLLEMINLFKQIDSNR